MTFTDWRGRSVGIIYWNPALAWKPRADLVLFNCQAALTQPYFKGIDARRLVLTYYYWDNQYRAFDTIEKYREFLKRYRDWGVNKTAFHDWSTWYTEPEQQRYDTIMKVFDYAEAADALGFELTWNNNLTTARVEEVLKRLPRIDTYLVSANHYEDTVDPQAIRNGRIAYEIMVTQKRARRVLYLTGRQNHSTTPWFFDGRVEVSVIPTERRAMQFLRQTVYGDSRKGAKK